MEKQNGRRTFLKYLFSLSAFVAGSKLSFNKSKGNKFGKISQKEAWGKGSSGKKFKKIAVEEHFHTEEYLSWQGSKTEWKGSPRADAAVKVTNLGEGRIKEMDESGIDMQVLSLSYPGLDIFKTADAIALAKSINNELSEAIKRYPKRFSGYCCIPLQDPNAAADELERGVTKLGLRGATVNINTPERWLSDQKYEVIFERLAKLDVPIYLHTDGPSNEDSGLHIVPEVTRLMNSGLFEKYPKLTCILGHAGESLPFWLNRLDGRAGNRIPQGASMPNSPGAGAPGAGMPNTSGAGVPGAQGAMSPVSVARRLPSQCFKEHFFVSTSSQCWPALLQFLIAALGADRILFATDYPYESIKQHVDFIDSAPISDNDREKICNLNAKELFKL
jgi:predicted TIM-barrel fold metal-dependent hydrolase